MNITIARVQRALAVKVPPGMPCYAEARRREREVAEAYAKGASFKELAVRFKLSENHPRNLVAAFCCRAECYEEDAVSR